MRNRIAVAALAASALLLAPAIAQDTQEAGLGWKLQKGEKSRYAYAYELSTAIEVMGFPQNQSQKLTLHLAQEVKDVTPEGATIEATIERILVSVDMGAMLGGPQTYDSAKAAPKKEKKAEDEDEGDDTASVLEPLGEAVGEKFTFKLSRTGEVTNLTGLDEVFTKIATKNPLDPGAMPKGGGNDMRGMMKAMKVLALPMALMLLRSETVLPTLNLQCNLFPKDAAGESWTKEASQDLAAVGKLTFQRKIEKKGEGEHAGEKGLKLFHTSVDKPKLEPMKAPEGMGAPGGGNPFGQMAAAMGKQKVKDTSYEGTSIFSREKGRLLKGEITETVTLESSMKNPFGGGGRKRPKFDEDEDEDEPKKKDEKKEEKGEDEEDEGPQMKMNRKLKIVLRYELLTGEAPKAPEKPAEKTPTGPDKKGSF